MTHDDLMHRDMDDITAHLAGLGWPPALVKAGIDPYDYAIGLRSGAVICFREAEITDTLGWVHLCDVRSLTAAPATERGMDVRLVEIVWVADLGR